MQHPIWSEIDELCSHFYIVLPVSWAVYQVAIIFVVILMQLLKPSILFLFDDVFSALLPGRICLDYSTWNIFLGYIDYAKGFVESMCEWVFISSIVPYNLSHNK